MKWIYALVALLSVSCGSNIFESALEPSTDKAKLAEAQKYLDKGEYSEALEWVEKVEGSSNQRQLLEASARLGAADMGVWQIFTSVLSVEGQSADTLSVNSIYDELSSSSFGEGELRRAKLEALRLSIKALLEADRPGDARVENLVCFIAGLLSVGSALEGGDAVTSLQSELVAIVNNSQGSASTDAECPGVESLDESFANFDSLAKSISLLGQLGVECKYFSTQSGSSNKAELPSKDIKMLSLTPPLVPGFGWDPLEVRNIVQDSINNVPKEQSSSNKASSVKQSCKTIRK